MPTLDELVQLMRRLNPDQVVMLEGNDLKTYVKAGHYKCDFCSGKGPFKRYDAEPFVINFGEVPQGSDGAWLACKTCTEMIERNDRKGPCQTLR